MTIAVSSPLKPSRFFSRCTLGMTVFHALTGVFILASLLGNFEPVVRAGVGLACLFAAFLFILLRRCFMGDGYIRISPSGQIHLSGCTESSPFLPFRRGRPVSDAEIFHIGERSTVLPILLLLHLEPDSGKRRIFLCIFPDMMPDGMFSALYVSCQWLLTRAEKESVFRDSDKT
ncbi:MAG: hypothetical protein LBK01_02880 [Burkholderiaceae bacterium]|jgi:hypothetical protein|nr:hypothetical protein [Burkholderiaceae bacterium]